MIIVQPRSGLCNRMRVINSCIALAKMYSPSFNKIKMIWEENNLLNCRFLDLFQPIDEIELIGSHRLMNYFKFYYKNQNLPLRSKIRRIQLSLSAQKFNYYDDNTIMPLRFDLEYWKSNNDNLIFNTCQDFINYDYRNYYFLFKPVEGLQNLIDKQIEKFATKTIGVHIRGTDNEESRKVSKTDLFVKEINSLLYKDEKIRFYLATDEPKIEEYLLSEFGENIIIQENKTLNRNLSKGIQDSLIDLYVLSNTNYIIGSYWSSFTAMAGWLRKIPFKILK